MLQCRNKLIAVAGGREQPDLILKGGTIVNVFSGEMIEADVAIADGFIAGIGDYEGPEILDVRGGIICPGFIEGHLHLESTMTARTSSPSSTRK